MERNFFIFYKTSLKNLFEASVNTLTFLPYFFSVISLLKTLFFPWKNMVSHEKWPDRLFFNLISRIIGFSMRVSVLLFYFMLQTLFIIFIPFIGVVYLILIPVFYIKSLFRTPIEEKKIKYNENFISAHLTNADNRLVVEHWFEIYYRKKYLKKPWWKLSNLFFIPPLARDWAMGFTPTLDQYSTDLTSIAYQQKTKNMLDRHDEIEEIIRSLTLAEKANVIVVGDEGVGKHTIIDALAKKMYEGRTNNHLIYKRILKLNMEKIISDNIFPALIKEAEDSNSVILMIEDFEKYVSLIKRNFVQIIGVTTPFAFQKFIMPSGLINQMFTKVDVYEISKSQAMEIMLDNTFIYEDRYKIIIPYESIKAIVDKSDFYITHIPFPEKALELLDSACVFTTTTGRDKSRLVPILTPEIIDTVLTEKTHIQTSLTAQIKQKLINLETLLNEKIIEQKEAMSALASALRRSFMLLGLRKKPLMAFLFLGPTGVGKTQTAKTLADIFFGGESHLIRFDMSQFQSKEDIPKLIGSMESGNPGLLTAAVRQNPYGVLLLDEFEKADHDLINIFLTVFDEGYFTDGYGKKIDCKNLAIIATSNAKDINQTFSPEMLNRFDGVIRYQRLSKTAALTVAKQMVDRIKSDIYKLHKVTVGVSDNYLQQLANRSYDDKFGARNMERLIRDEIEDKIAKLLLVDKVGEGQTIQL